jgi:hypothetical protein
MTGFGDKLLPPPPRAEASSGERTAYLRNFIRPYALLLAACHLVGDEIEDEPDANMREVILAAIGHAELNGLSRAEAVTAAEAEWNAATERAANMLSALRKTVWPLGRIEAPSCHVIAEARAVNHRFGWVLPTELLIEQAGIIARSAVPRSGRRRRYAKW